MPPALSSTFAAFKHKNYRYWFAGQLVSLIGTWMQSTAQGYLVYQLTQSSAYLGYVAFAGGIPTWIFMLYGGAIADRVPRRKLLIITQAGQMILAFVLAGLVISNLVQPWHIIILSFLLGIINSFDAPSRQAFIVELVEDRRDMTNAIALNSSMFNLAIIIGPSIGAMTYALVGPGLCFTLNGISFIAVIISLLLMKVNDTPPPRQNTSTLAEIKTGLSFVAQEKNIRTIILNVGVFSIFGIGMMTLMPAWAVEVLHGNVTTNGFLLSARGLGALIGALTIATLSNYGIKGKLWTVGSFVMPVIMFIFSLTSILPLSLFCLIIFGFTIMLIFNTSNALVQSRVPDELRGRVMGLYTMIFLGCSPIGSLLMGSMATWLSEPASVMISSGVVMFIALYNWFQAPQLRKLT